MFFRDTWHHPYITSCFCGKRFYSPCFFAFSGVQAALWHVQPCTESKGRGCADNYSLYALCCCVLSFLVCTATILSTWVVDHGMVATYPSLFLKFFHQLFFPCRHMCSSETLGTISTCFCRKRFHFHCFFTYGVQAALWQVQSCLRNNRLKVHRNERRLWHAEHDSSASCMFYSMSRHSREKISAQSSAVIRTGACPTGY